MAERWLVVDKHLAAYYQGMAVLLSALLAAMFMTMMRLPHLDIMVAVCAVLPIGVIHAEPSLRTRLARMGTIVVLAAFLQFVIGMLIRQKFLVLVIPSLITLLYFLYVPRTTVSTVAVTIGWQGISAQGGLLPSFDRAMAMLFSFGAALLATEIARLFEDKSIYCPVPHPYHASFSRALRMTVVIGLSAYTELFWQLPQGNWLVLTVCLIYTVATPDRDMVRISLQRALWAPLGLLLAFFFMANLTFFNYQIIYILPLLAAITFYLYYRFDHYGIFTALFMMTLALYADLMSDEYARMNLQNIYTLRVFNTALASVLVMFFNRFFLPTDTQEESWEDNHA